MDSPILQKLLPEQRRVAEPPSAISAEEFRDPPNLAECAAEQPVNPESARVPRKIKKSGEIRALKDDKC